MGGTTFEHYVPEPDVATAFRRAHEEAGYEHGMGGYSGTIVEKPDYTVITHTPLLESEARALASRLIDAGDSRIDDKWGPAGALPIVSSTRTVAAKGFQYTPAQNVSTGTIDPNLLEAVGPLVKLRRGETIQNVTLTSYSQPERRGGGYYGHSRPLPQPRLNCQAQVTINKPPTTRKVSATVDIPGGLDYDQRRKEIQERVDALRLKAGEKAISWRETKDTPGPAKVTAVAPKGATETRYIVVGKDRWNKTVSPVQGVGHGTWDDGFASQAEARQWLTGVAKNEKNWVGNAPLRHLGDDVTLEIESVTRRTGGEPLVRVTRQVGQRQVEVEVEVKIANAKTDTVDGWLFFGWASC